VLICNELRTVDHPTDDAWKEYGKREAKTLTGGFWSAGLDPPPNPIPRSIVSKVGLPKNSPPCPSPYALLVFGRYSPFPFIAPPAFEGPLPVALALLPWMVVAVRLGERGFAELVDNRNGDVELEAGAVLVEFCALPLTEPSRRPAATDGLVDAEEEVEGSPSMDRPIDMAPHPSSSSASSARARRAFESDGREVGDVLLSGGDPEVVERF
jgi:hypothetical protein